MVFVRGDERIEVTNTNLYSIYLREGYIEATEIAEPTEKPTPKKRASKK